MNYKPKYLKHLLIDKVLKQSPVVGSSTLAAGGSGEPGV